MANTGGIRAGKAFVEVYAKNTELIRGLAEASRHLKQFGQGVSAIGKTMMGAGAALAAPFLAASKHFMDAGSKLNDMAARTGMSTNALSELGYAAKMTGASIEEVEIATKKMQKEISAAKDGPLAKLKGMAPEKQFMAVAESIAQIKDPTAKAAAALSVFGKSGTQLLPMLDDMKALRAEAVRLGLSVSSSQAKAADELGDAWDRVKASLGGVAMAVGSQLADTLTGLANQVTGHIADIRNWIAANGELILGVARLAVQIAAAGAALFVFGKALAAAGAALASLRAASLAMLALSGPQVVALAAIAAAAIAVGVAYKSAYDSHQRFNSGMAAQKQGALGSTGTFDKGAASGDRTQTDQGIAALQRNRDTAAKNVADAEAGLKTNRTVLEWAMGWDNSQAAKDLEQKKIDLAMAEVLLNRFKEIQKGMIDSGKIAYGAKISKGIGGAIDGIGSAVEAGKEFGKNFLDGMKKSWQENRSLFDDLARIRNEGIDNPQQRDEAQKNLEYDIKAREAAEKGLNVAAVEAARQAELKNIRDKYAKEQKKSEEQIAYDTEEAKINATQKGKDKELALLRLRQAKERDEAKKNGIDPALLADKQKFEELALLNGASTEAASKTRGTFSASELGSMAGSSPVRKMAAGIDKLVKLSQDTLDEQKRLTLECVA